MRGMWLDEEYVSSDKKWNLLNACGRVKSPNVTLPMRTGPVATVPSLDGKREISH